MARCMRIYSVLAAVAVCLAISLVCFCCVGLMHHNCDGDMCELCLQISLTDTLIKSLLLVFAFLGVVLLCTREMHTFTENIAKALYTPLDMKVRLLN